MNGGASRPLLAADVLGRYERTLWRIPLWMALALVALVLLTVAADVSTGQPGRAVVPAVGAVAVLVLSVRRRRRPPAVSTELSQNGVVVSSTAGKRDVVPWEQVVGVRVFRRRSMPQVVLSDGSPVQLLAVPDEVARSLAAQLPAVLGRPVWFEVDDHRTDPAAPPTVTVTAEE